MNLVELIKDQISGTMLGKLASLLGESESKTESAVGAAVPALLAGLAKVASTDEGARKLKHAVDGFDIGSIGEMAHTMSDQSGTLLQRGTSLVTTLLGGDLLSSLTGALSRFGGLGTGTAKNLLGYLMPLAIGTIAGQAKTKGLDTQGLASMLAGQQEHIADALPRGLSMADITGPSIGRGPRLSEPSRVRAETPKMAWLWPLLGLAAAAVLLAFYFWPRNEPATDKTPVVQTRQPAPEPPIGDRNANLVSASKTIAIDPDAAKIETQLSGVVTNLIKTLSSVKDTETADAALPKLQEINSTLSDLKERTQKLPDAVKRSVTTPVGTALTRLRELAAKVTEIRGIGERIKPVVDEILDKLTTLTT